MFSAWFFLAILNVLDVWTTYKTLHTVLGAVEANPFSRWLIDNNILIAWKAVIVAFAGFWCFKTQNPVRYAQVLWVVVVIFSFAVYSNLRILY